MGFHGLALLPLLRVGWVGAGAFSHCAWGFLGIRAAIGTLPLPFSPPLWTRWARWTFCWWQLSISHPRPYPVSTRNSRHALARSNDFLSQLPTFGPTFGRPPPLFFLDIRVR
jgi:hypothetical protein